MMEQPQMMEQPISVQLRQGADPNHVMLKLLVHGTEPAIRDKHSRAPGLLENDLEASDQDTRHANLDALLTLYEQPNQGAVLQQPSSSKPELGQQAQLPQKPQEPDGGAITGQDTGTVTTNAASASSSSPLLSQQTLAGKWCLLVAARPTPLVCALAESLLPQGARVTLAVRHTQDALLTVRQLSKRLQPHAQTLLAASETAIDFASPSSISRFAAAVNATTDQGPLDLLLLDAAEGLVGGGRGGKRRWYTPSGVAGNAQEGFVGPASLLHLLQPQLTRSKTRLLLTCSPSHRLSRVDGLQQLLHTWATATPAATQVALLAYVRQLAQEAGLTAAAVDVGALRETQQLLHLLLPSASDSAQLITSIAGDMMTAGKANSSPGAGGSSGVAEQEAGAGAAQQKQDAGGSEMQAQPRKSFSYYSHGLLAAPLLTSVDLAGSSNRLTHLMSSLAWPWWQLAASSAITAAQLLDWPVRAWLLAPAGLVTGWSQKLLGSRAVGAISQLQRLVPGVVGVPQGTVPCWVEVLPSGQVAQGRLGREAWGYINSLNDG